MQDVLHCSLDDEFGALKLARLPQISIQEPNGLGFR